MKLSLTDRTAEPGPEGHLVRELLGMATMNISKYSLAHIVAPPSAPGTMRQNQFDEIVIVIKGHGTVQQEYTTEQVGPNDVVLLPAGTRYAVEAVGEEPLEFWALCVPAFRPEWSSLGSTKRDWRDYQVPRGADRLRPHRIDE